MSETDKHEIVTCDIFGIVNCNLFGTSNKDKNDRKNCIGAQKITLKNLSAEKNWASHSNSIGPLPT